MRSKPSAKPPNMIPQYCPAMKGTGPNYIQQYVGFLVYVWTVDGRGFWIYPLSVQGGVLYGYIWKDTYYEYAQFNISKIDCLY